MHLFSICAHGGLFCAMSLFSQARKGEELMWRGKEVADAKWFDQVPCTQLMDIKGAGEDEVWKP